MYWGRHLLTAAATVVLLSACAEEREPINRVQPNVVRKADLEGEWFYQQTVIDMDTSANYSVIGDNAFWNLERIRWDIQENYLYAHRAFEWVDNSDTTDFELEVSGGRAVNAAVTQDGRPYMGAVVAAYRITSHFDIRREYNPTTGEEINVIGENTSDRPWHEREFMRVDWSENLATDFDFDFFYYANGELNIDPVPFYVQDNGPAELRPVFDYDGSGQLWYFDFVQQLTVHPGSTYLDYYGMDIPTCWFFENQGVDCATTTLTVRASFLRTNDDEEDYEPLEFKGAITEMFGFWTVDRMRYHHREGFREENRRRLAQVHNTWERSHTDDVCQVDTDCETPGSVCDDNLGFQPAVCSVPWTETHFDINCETDDDCELSGSYCHERMDGNVRQCTIPDVSMYAGQTCLQDEECPTGTVCLNAGRCTIPYRDRSPKPIIFYLVGGWPEDLAQGGMWDRLEAEYDWALRRATAAAQLTSQMTEAIADDDNQRVDEIRERLDNIEMECDSDSQCDQYWDGSTCATEGSFVGHCTTPVRQMFYLCNSPVRPDNPPECGPTGRVIRMGDIRYNQLHYSREWNPLSPLGQSPTAPDPLSGRVFGSTVSLYDAVDTVAFSIYEQASLLNGTLDPVDYVNGVDLTDWLHRHDDQENESQDRTVDQEEIRGMYRARSNDWMDGLRLPESSERNIPEGHGHEVMNQALGQLRQTGAFDASRDPGDSFLYSLHGSPIEDLMMNDEIMMMHNIAPGTPPTDEVRDSASIASPDFRSWQDIQERWVQSHNWGRNILYADLYWVPVEQLADHVNGMDPEEAYRYIRLRVWESVIVHELGHNLGLYHNFAGSEDSVNFDTDWWSARTEGFTTNPAPRTEQPVSDYEIANGLNDLHYSSVMDYNANYAAGERLGRYDRAALLFGYGRSVEVFRNVSGGVSSSDLEEYWSSSGSFLQFISTGLRSLHYTRMYRLMGTDLISNSNRMILPVDGVQENLMSVTDPASPGGRSYTRVPYLYCNDNRADLGENCHRWDFGVDPYERMQDLITRDDLYYLRNSFRRGAIQGTAEGSYSYIYERQYERFKLMHDYYLLIDALCHMYYSDEQCEEFFTDPDEGWGAYTVAIHDGFNHMMQNLTRPDVNVYESTDRADGSEAYQESAFGSADMLALPVGDGRYFSSAWWDTNYNDDCGTDFWECLHHYGFYGNKMLLLMALSEAETFFVTRDTSEDIRMWRMSYYDDYSEAIMDAMGGIMSEDYSAFAPYITDSGEVDSDGDSIGELIFRNYANPDEDPVLRGRIPDESWPVDPYTGFTVQLYAAVIGFARLHTNFDNRFITSSRMWICGGDHGVDPGEDGGTEPGRPVIRFDDPETGLAYCAINREDGLGISQRMLLQANQLRSRTDYCNDDDPDAFDACDASVNREQRVQAEQSMLLYRDQLDIMVHLTARYDNWMFSYGDPLNPGDVPEDW